MKNATAIKLNEAQTTLVKYLTSKEVVDRHFFAEQGHSDLTLPELCKAMNKQEGWSKDFTKQVAYSINEKSKIKLICIWDMNDESVRGENNLIVNPYSNEMLQLISKHNPERKKDYINQSYEGSEDLFSKELNEVVFFGEEEKINSSIINEALELLLQKKLDEMATLDKLLQEKKKEIEEIYNARVCK